LSYTRE